MTTLESTFGESTPGTQKTSGMAVAALICSLICCLPITTIPGVILGIAAAVSIKGNPARKGMGIAITAIVLGALFTLGQALIYPVTFRVIKESMELVESGPEDALNLGFSGDLAGFKASFHGDGATASDVEALAFLDELTDRYGAFRSCRFDEQAGSQMQPQFGTPIVPFPYVMEFENATVSAESEIAFSDPQRGGFIMKIHSITVFDTEMGDLVYPPPTGVIEEPPPQPAPPPDIEPEPDLTLPEGEEVTPPPVEPDGGG